MAADSRKRRGRDVASSGSVRGYKIADGAEFLGPARREIRRGVVVLWRQRQLRINTDNSHHRYDVILLINGVPAVQVELKTLQINPRRAIEQIVEYKNDPGNGYNKA